MVKKNTVETNKSLEAKADATNMEQKEAEKQEEIVEEKKKSDTVVVCCGIPMGQILNPIVDGKEVEVHLAGIPYSWNVRAINGQPLVAGKFGETVVERKVWDAIVKKYGACDFIENRVIFAKEEKEEAEEEARERTNAGEKLGFEQAEKEPTPDGTHPAKEK